MICEYYKKTWGKHETDEFDIAGNFHPKNNQKEYLYCSFAKHDGEFGSHEQACPCNGDKNNCPYINN